MAKVYCIKRTTYSATHRPIDKTWCGKTISDTVFNTIDSAIINRLALGEITVCQECWGVVMKLIERDTMTQKREGDNDNG